MKTKFYFLLVTAFFVFASTNAKQPETRFSTFYAVSSYEEERAAVTKILEEICERCYGHMFTGRTYVQRSIYVSDFSRSNRRIWAKGTHSYKGRLGTVYTNMKFEVTIDRTDGNNGLVKFQKLSAPDWLHDDYYWEYGEINLIED